MEIDSRSCEASPGAGFGSRYRVLDTGIPDGTRNEMQHFHSPLCPSGAWEPAMHAGEKVEDLLS